MRSCMFGLMKPYSPIMEPLFLRGPMHGLAWWAAR